MLDVLSRLVLAGVLAAAAISKLASPRSSQAALATFGLAGGGARGALWAALIGAELALAAGVGLGSDAAAWGAATLLLLFAGALVSAILSGRAGAPCACFGSRSVVGWLGVARNVALAGCFVALPFVPDADLTTDQWLGIGLGVALLACAGLAVAVLALAREVGLLRLQLGPSAALEVPGEGPEVGAATPLIQRFPLRSETRFALAVFVSDGCHVCRTLEPQIAALGRDPLVAVETFEEFADAEAWRRLSIPGSPFAVALDREGVVLAKGTFNNLAQLESVLGTAERRQAESAVPQPRSGAAVGGGA